MTISETQQGTEIPVERRPPGGGSRRRGLAAVSAGVVAVVLAGAAVAAARGGGPRVAETAAGPVVAPTSADGKIASAMLAAPVAVSRDATILDVPGADLKYPVLREGASAWSCFPDWSVTPVEDPMCVDRNAKAWVDAYYAGKEPKLKAAGIIYMLRGSGDFSRTDALATELAPGQHWVDDGPHITVVSPGKFDANDYASLGTAAPWVMWAGSPYEHLHVPIR